MLEGNRKKVLKLRKELKLKLNRNGITCKEVLPEIEPVKKKIVEKVIEKIIEPKKEIKKTPGRRKRR